MIASYTFLQTKTAHSALFSCTELFTFRITPHYIITAGVLSPLLYTFSIIQTIVLPFLDFAITCAQHELTFVSTRKNVAHVG